jgi:hypothetical protein
LPIEEPEEEPDLGDDDDDDEQDERARRNPSALALRRQISLGGSPCEKIFSYDLA